MIRDLFAGSLVLENTQKSLFFKSGASKIKMSFSPYIAAIEKVRVTKYFLGIIPVGLQFCEISLDNKAYLREQFKTS